MATWRIDHSRIFSLSEIALVLKDLRRKGKRSYLTRQRLILFRLSTCCGLRVGELVQLTLADIQGGERPHIRIRPAITKADGKRKRYGRSVPLWWDIGTLMDIVEWKRQLEAAGAKPNDLLLTTRRGTPIDRGSARLQFRTACKPLGRDVTIHDGRHTFVSHMLAVGRSIKSVADAAGHRSLGATSQYCHSCPEYEDGRPVNMFGPHDPDSQRQAAIKSMEALGWTDPNLIFGVHQAVVGRDGVRIAAPPEFEHAPEADDEEVRRRIALVWGQPPKRLRRPLRGACKTRYEARLLREAERIESDITLTARVVAPKEGRGDKVLEPMEDLIALGT